MSSKPVKAVTLPADLYARLDAAAKGRELTTGGLLAHIVREWLEHQDSMQRRVERR